MVSTFRQSHVCVIQIYRCRRHYGNTASWQFFFLPSCAFCVQQNAAAVPFCNQSRVIFVLHCHIIDSMSVSVYFYSFVFMRSSIKTKRWLTHSARIKNKSRSFYGAINPNVDNLAFPFVKHQKTRHWLFYSTRFSSFD